MGVSILTDKLFNTNALLLDSRQEGGEAGGKEAAD